MSRKALWILAAVVIIFGAVWYSRCSKDAPKPKAQVEGKAR